MKFIIGNLSNCHIVVNLNLKISFYAKENRTYYQ
jgi:hypothetical protein